MNTDSSQFITGREVAVLDMLNARDRRHAIQQELIRTHNATVISFTLNIPGPIKVFPLGEMTFEEGIRLIDSQLHAWIPKERSLAKIRENGSWPFSCSFSMPQRANFSK